MPRVSGVSGSSTVWRSRRSPMPWTVLACVLLKPMVLRTSVTFSFLSVACATSVPRLRADQLAFFLAAHPRHGRRVLQLHQSAERRAHDVVRVGRAERLGQHVLDACTLH